MSNKEQLLIVSTRLPVTVTKNDGVLSYASSSGGLATGMAYVSQSKRSLWIGWPGIASDLLSEKDKQQITKELKKYDCSPVFLTQAQLDMYYSGYCNATLWPLFHYFPNKTEYKKEYWQSYQEINELFGEAIKPHLNSQTTTWVHDYQLFLLPKILREHTAQAKIGFFLHTPFPSFEIFRLLPEKTLLLEGVMGADLIGFHTYDYVRHFLSSVRRTLGVESSLGTMQYQKRVIQVDAFPIGIDYDKFAKSSRKRRLHTIASSLTKSKTKVILAVDRSDYSKGIPQRLEAYSLFLGSHPEYHGKVSFVLLAVPSRGDVSAYQELRTTIEQNVSRINGEFGTVEWTPIIYLHQSLPFNELTALYDLADVMLVTPLRDGMNLVAKEYVATKHQKNGVLVLSEMAGVASEFPEALQVNPNDRHAVAENIVNALQMPVKEQKERMRAMQQRISKYTIGVWAEDFLTQLNKLTATKKTTIIEAQDKRELLKQYSSAQNRLILLDYDGTLHEFVKSPAAAMARPTKKVKAVLKNLNKDPCNTTVIISGRPKNILQDFFTDTKLGLIAEHGGWVFDAGDWVKSSLGSKKWKKEVRNLLEAYTSRTPGAVIEEKDFSMVWHYRQVMPELAYVRAQELKMELQHLLAESDIDVFEGNKIVEIKPRRMHKGALLADMLAKESWDFVMAIGDDYTDEDMFAVMPENSYSIHVGIEETKARFSVNAVSDVVELIEELSKLG